MAAGTPRPGSIGSSSPANLPATDHIVEGLQDLEVGDFIPDGPPESGCGFVVEQLDPEHCIVLHSETHLPKALREHDRARLDWTWTFLLRDLGQGRTRFVFRCRGRLTPWWLRLAYSALIIPADFVMSRQMIGGIESRATSGGAAAGP